MLAPVIKNALLSDVMAYTRSDKSKMLLYYLVMSEEMLAPIIKNTLWSNVIAHTRSGKCRMLLYNLVVVFSLAIA